jgi:hypothetical protein
MIPPAAPMIASITGRGADRKKRTGSVPTAVSSHVPVVAMSAWRMGLRRTLPASARSAYDLAPHPDWQVRTVARRLTKMPFS